MENEKEPVQYYWCINCGHYGDLGKPYLIHKDCENCGYDEITPFTPDEIMEHEDLSFNKFKRKK